MAQTLAKSFKLQLIYETGIGDNGKPILKRKTYNGVVEEATADQLYQVGHGLASLSIHPLSFVEKSAIYEVMG
ncbi:DUF1659 domain-containing protein [Bacillus tuaregi]|uniref:DUF1659 domain-containing protein n=1 Tax=Bacillus tuaregi TaxID=1816695 RepID=UPI0008F84FDD|nr:DUF1659 domain-containing protein [Bacillus tuaregi]